MGTQGEIFNILGFKIPVKTIEKNKLYSVNEKTVSTCFEYEEKSDFINGISWKGAENPELSIYLLGFDEGYYKDRHFKGEALVGYAIANESYAHNATVVPSTKVIESLKPKLSEDIKSKLGIKIEQTSLEIYLLFALSQ